MQEDSAGKITYGAMMMALFAILLTVSLYIPIVGAFTMFFIPLPMILYRLRYDRTASLFLLPVGIVLTLLIGGGIVLLPFSLVFMLVGFIIGDTVKTGKTKLYTFMATGLTLLTFAITIYVATVLFFKINFVELLIDELRAVQNSITSLFVQYGELPANFEEQLDASIALYEITVPAIFIIFMFSLAFIFVTLNLTLVKRLGHSIPKFPPFREMKLPIITVWYYLLVLFSGFIFDMEPGTYTNLIYNNATVLLRFLFFIQGISLIYFYMHEIKAPKWVTVLSTIPALLLSPITVLLGILDVGLKIRTWIGKNKQK